MQAVCKSIATSTVQSFIESVRGKDLVETPQGDKQAKASRDSLSALVGECSRVTNGKCLTMVEDWNFESTSLPTCVVHICVFMWCTESYSSSRGGVSNDSLLASFFLPK